MNNILILCLLLVKMGSLSQFDQIQSVYSIENFEKGQIGGLPLDWYNQKGSVSTKDFNNNLRLTYSYKIMNEINNKFLRFEGIAGKHISYPLINKKEINIYDTPVLSWKWRIHQVPLNANEGTNTRNDVAASIYVVFEIARGPLFAKIPKTIRYTWSSTLPKGTELSKNFGNQKIIVVGTGKNTDGKWKSFERNIVDDYKRLFGGKPPVKPIAVLILSDADDTNFPIKADYDDIKLHSGYIN